MVYNWDLMAFNRLSNWYVMVLVYNWDLMAVVLGMAMTTRTPKRA